MQSHRLPGVNNRTGFVDPRKPSYSAGFEQGHKDTGKEHRCKSGLSQKSGYISTKAYGLGDTVTLEKAQENHEAVTAVSERQNSDSQGTQIQQRNGISSGKANGKHRIGEDDRQSHECGEAEELTCTYLNQERKKFTIVN